jgi:lipopolysaccharide export system protein LptC
VEELLISFMIKPVISSQGLVWRILLRYAQIWFFSVQAWVVVMQNPSSTALFEPLDAVSVSTSHLSLPPKQVLDLRAGNAADATLASPLSQKNTSGKKQLSSTKTRSASQKIDPAYRSAQRHTLWVKFLKFSIPVGALVAAGLIVFVSYFKNLTKDASVSVGAVTLSGTKITMEKPHLTGFRGKDSKPYEVTAVSAAQDIRSPNVVELTTLKAIVNAEQNSKTRMEADFGIYDSQKEQIDLKRNVRVRTDSGYDAKLSSAFVDFKGGTVISKEPVKVDFSGGSIESDRMDITDGGKKMVFEGRVHTVFTTPAPAEKSPKKP